MLPRGSVTAFHAKYVRNDETPKKSWEILGVKIEQNSKSHSEYFLEKSKLNDL